MSIDLSAFSHLTPAEKLALAQALWDDVAANPDDVPIPQWHLDELEKREAEFEKNPEPEMTLEEAIKWVLDRNGRKT